MKILFIGDIFGKPGRKIVEKVLNPYREENGIDFVIANGENILHGKGISEKNVTDMKAAGIDFFTSGNHVFSHRDIMPLMEDESFPLVRPANYPIGVPGRGFAVVKTSEDKKILIINLLGRVFIKEDTDCPFRAADAILERFKDVKPDAIFVDFHAEATSEKVALGYYLDGRVSAVLGTHTHIATADARILEKGTAYQTDVGFTGPRDSCIGVKKEIIIQHFLTQMKVKHEVAEGPVIFSATEFAVKEGGILAESIKPVSITLDDL